MLPTQRECKECERSMTKNQDRLRKERDHYAEASHGKSEHIAALRAKLREVSAALAQLDRIYADEHDPTDEYGDSRPQWLRDALAEE